MKTERIFNFIYCIGAAAVVIGAMGKILHYSWSDVVLQISLILEAGIFVLLGIQELTTKSSQSAAFPKIESPDNTELTNSINNLNQTIKHVFNR